ncbi:YbjN domain-containing protein [Corynebacterium sp. S7]
MDEKNLPQPFSIEQVTTILHDENLDYRIETAPTETGETTVVRTGFANAAIAFVQEDNTLVCEALWRGEFPRALATNLLAACNEYNQMQFAPTLRFYENGEHHLSANAYRILDISHGASFNQVGAFVMSTMDAIVGAFDFLGKQFPDLVTWEETHEQ